MFFANPVPSFSALAQVADQTLNHSVRILAMFAHVVDESVPITVQSKPVVLPQSLPSLSSPIKRKSRTGASSPAKEREEKSEEKRSRGPVLGYFMNVPHCVRIFELLRSAHSNYKLTLDSQASEKFLAVLRTTLNVISQVFEVTSLNEIGRFAEELLNYLKVTAAIEPVATVTCVQQLLKSLFGTNIAAQSLEPRQKHPEKRYSAREYRVNRFYDYCFVIPYKELSSTFDAHKVAPQNEWTLNYRNAQSPPFKGKDRAALASYIKLFEPMVIKALEQYTVTSDVKLQCKVLQLLSQLVQLRVNYCLLDSDKIFINFVLKQFELIEEGHIVWAEELIPQIFQFLVHLSYEKNHSKAIIGVPEVIQLCDGLMASGQPPVTHCIPALVPVVEDVFLIRGGSLGGNVSTELDTQREVLVAVLLRLVEYHQVLELLDVVLRHSQFNNKERWLRWSIQVANALWPRLEQYQVRLESQAAQTALLTLLDSLAPSATQPVDPLLQVIFSESPAGSALSMQRWLGGVLGVLSQLLLHSSEDEVLACLATLDLSMSPMLGDPLKASKYHTTESPEVLLSRHMFRLVELFASHICEVVLQSGHAPSEMEYLEHQFSHFLLYYIYMLESGRYCKVAAASIRLLRDPSSLDEEPLPLENINKLFLTLGPFFPLLTFHWCYMLILLSYNDHMFWTKVLMTEASDAGQRSASHSGASSCCNLEIVRRGGIILFSDYVCDNLADVEQVTWLLVHHMEDIVALSEEVPVQELIASVHRNPAASGLLVQAVAARCEGLKRPSLIARLLEECLAGVHPSQSGALLQLLASRLLGIPQVALARKAGMVACKRAEMLLTATPEEVQEQLTESDLQTLLLKVANKHERLRNILNKVGEQFYNLPPDHSKTFDPANTKTISPDNAWLVAQVKQRSCHPEAVGQTICQMLSELSFNELLDVIGSPKFNLSLLEDCFNHGCRLSLQKCGRLVEGSIVSPLFEASQASLVHRILRIEEFLPKPHQVFQPMGRASTSKEQKFSQRLSTLFSEPTIWQPLVHLSRAVPSYFTSMARLSLHYFLPTKHWSDFARFGILCLEACHWQVQTVGAQNLCPGALEAALSCAASILTVTHIAQELTSSPHHAWLASGVNAVFAVMHFLLQGDLSVLPHQAPGLEMPQSLKELEAKENMAIIHACPQISSLLTCLQRPSTSIPTYLYEPLRTVIIGLSRLAPLNSYAVTPLEVWQQGWAVPLTGPTSTTVPPIPVEMLLEPHILEQFICRLNQVGWTSRQQFEENWMALLGVLNSSHDEAMVSQEEANVTIQINVLALRGITALLVQTLLLPIPGHPAVSKLIHQPRPLKQSPACEQQEQLEKIHTLISWLMEDVVLTRNCQWQYLSIFNRPNQERVGLNNKYGYSQVSIQYLLSVINASEEPQSPKPELHLKREECLVNSGLDIHSCLHFLLDLYAQWISPQAHTSQKLLLEAVRSVLMVSDIFTERAQFQWMLHTFLDFAKAHPSEDEMVHQFLALGACKAAAVLGVNDVETMDRVREMVEISLKSAFLPSRLSGLHGLLYLIQSPQFASLPGSDDIRQLGIDYIQRHTDLASGSSNHSERHLLAFWALLFFLLEEEQVNDTEMAPGVLQLAMALVSAGTLPLSLNTALVQGLERLVSCGTLTGNVSDQVTSLAVERLRHNNPGICFSALQLLLTCMYSGMKKQSIEESDPEVLLQSLEKTSSIFDRMKKGYPYEAKLFCGVLPTLLADFFPPSEMLTKVLGEFLAVQQPHQKLLAGVVFKLFEQACEQEQLPLLQHWVVLSLSNFTKSLPIQTAVWCLTCFFVSASTNPWLRAVFPHIQSRIGRCDTEDRKMLCLAARDFYQKLSDEGQKDFRAPFRAASFQSAFADIVASL